MNKVFKFENVFVVGANDMEHAGIIARLHGYSPQQSDIVLVKRRPNNPKTLIGPQYLDEFRWMKMYNQK